jgi:hypothetical protein
MTTRGNSLVGPILRLIGTVILLPVLLLAMIGRDSHHLNPGYRLWKVGLFPYHENFIAFLNVDPDFRERLLGADLSSVKRLFPDLRATSQGDGYRGYYSDHQHGEESYWIGGTPWFIEFKDGRVTDFHLWKGPP